MCVRKCGARFNHFADAVMIWQNCVVRRKSVIHKDSSSSYTFPRRCVVSCENKAMSESYLQADFFLFLTKRSNKGDSMDFTSGRRPEKALSLGSFLVMKEIFVRTVDMWTTGFYPEEKRHCGSTNLSMFCSDTVLFLIYLQHGPKKEGGEGGPKWFIFNKREFLSHNAKWDTVRKSFGRVSCTCAKKRIDRISVVDMTKGIFLQCSSAPSALCEEEGPAFDALNIAI